MRLMRTYVISAILIVSLFCSSTTAFAEVVKYGEEIKIQPGKEYKELFTDVTLSHWAFQYIMDMSEKKIVSGYPDGKFRPDKTVSRAEFAKIMVSVIGTKVYKVTKSSFKDIEPSAWYCPYVEAVKKYVTGYSIAGGGFVYKPDQPVLREDVAVGIVRAKGYDIKLADRSIIEAMFTDYDGISEVAKDYVAIAVENRLISGYSDETFRAQKPVTRAEACALLWRAFMYGDENKVIPTDETPRTDDNPIDNPLIVPGSSNDNAGNKSQKYIVETLAGGNGIGQIDGKGNEAKVGKVWSIALDKNDNIFFLDNLQDYAGTGWYTEDAHGEIFFSNEKSYGMPVDYSRQKVRKYESSNGIVSTLVNTNSDLSSYNNRNVNEKSRTKYYDFAGYKLFTDAERKNVLLSGKFIKSSNSDEGSYAGSLFTINPTVAEAVYDRGFNYMCGKNDFAFYLEDGSIIYSRLDGSKFDIFRVKENSKPTKYTESCYNIDTSGDPRMDAFLRQGKLYVMLVRPGGDFASLIEYNLSTKEWIKLSEYDGVYAAVEVKGDKFYISKGASIYEVGIDGERRLFIDQRDLILSDNLPIGKIDLFDFDSKGNVVFYDSVNYAIRLIKL